MREEPRRPRVVGGSTWIRPATRWSVYLRDGLACLFCKQSAQEILSKTAHNFLTLDHFTTRAAGGGHEPANLTTACYECNHDRGDLSLRAWCTSRGWPYTTVKSRVWEARQRDVEPFREAARVLLGEYPGVPKADIVVLLSWRARQQFAGWQERMDWASDQIEICERCGHIPSVGSPPSAEDCPPF